MVSLQVHVCRSFGLVLANWIPYRKLAVVVALIGLAYFVLNKINGRDGMADFRVYYDAATAVWNDTTLYGKAFGVSSGFYKYSPLAALPFVPLSWLPYGLASGVYYFLVLGAILLLPVTAYRAVSHWLPGAEYLSAAPRAGIVTLLFMADHLERELHLGNVNLFLLLLAMTIFYALERGKDLLAGAGFALLLLFKPHFLILAPWLVYTRRFRVLFSTIIAVVAGLLLPVLWKGWDGNLFWLKEWMSTIQSHNTALHDSPNTLYGLLNRFVLTPLGVTAGTWLVLLVLATVAGAFLVFLRRNSGQPLSHFAAFFLLVALIPSLAHTDTEHFMWSMPLVFYTVWKWFESKRTQWWKVLLFVLAAIPYALNSPDLVGPTVARFFDEGGGIGLAHVVVMGLFLWEYIEDSVPEVSGSL
jgi:hypothetical protein